MTVERELEDEKVQKILQHEDEKMLKFLQHEDEKIQSLITVKREHDKEQVYFMAEKMQSLRIQLTIMTVFRVLCSVSWYLLLYFSS